MQDRQIRSPPVVTQAPHQVPDAFSKVPSPASCGDFSSWIKSGQRGKQARGTFYPGPTQEEHDNERGLRQANGRYVTLPQPRPAKGRVGFQFLRRRSGVRLWGRSPVCARGLIYYRLRNTASEGRSEDLRSRLSRQVPRYLPKYVDGLAICTTPKQRGRGERLFVGLRAE